MAILKCIRFTLMTLLVVFLFVSVALAEIQFTEIRSDWQHIIPFYEFGFTHTGRLELNVSHISINAPIPNRKFAKMGFFLCTRDALLHVFRQIDDGNISCALESEFVSTVFTFNNINVVDKSFQTVYAISNPDKYALLFENCFKDLQISMNVKSAMYNLKGKNGSRDYLSAGETLLPTVYFLFSLTYFALGCLWAHTLYKKQLKVFGIHFLMLAVVIINTLNFLAAAENMRYIKKTGSAHGWDVLFYIFSISKQVMMFLLIVLFGRSWPFLKPYLQDKKEKVLMMVIPLQVVANIAQVVIVEIGPFALDWATWKQIFLLVDVVFCCAILFPNNWSTEKMLKAFRTDGIYCLNLMYRTHYNRYLNIVVTGYGHFTRVVVNALETNTSYKYVWTSVVADELATFVFYAFIMRSLFWCIDGDEEEPVVEQLKLE